MLVLGIETSCDETAAAVVEATLARRRRGAFGRTSSPRRSTSIASGAASCPSSRRGSTCATSAASSSARWPTAARRWAGHRCAGRDAGAGPGRVAAGRRVVRQGGGLGARQAAGRGQSPGRPHRVDLARARRDRRCRRSCWSCPAATPASIWCKTRGRVSADRPHAGRCGGRGVRQGREAARRSGYPGGPIIDRLAREGNDDGDSLARHAADPSRSQRARARRPIRFQLQRPEDRGAAARAAAAGGARRRAAAASSEIVDLAASFQRRVVETLVDRTFAAARWHGAQVDRHRRRRVGELAPARGRARARRERSEIPVFIPQPAAVDRQRRDDRRRRACASSPPAGSRRAISTRRRRCRSNTTWPRRTRDTELLVMSITHSIPLPFNTRLASDSIASRRSWPSLVREERREGRHGARIGHAHHGVGVRQRLARTACIQRLPGRLEGAQRLRATSTYRHHADRLKTTPMHTEAAMMGIRCSPITKASLDSRPVGAASSTA